MSDAVRWDLFGEHIKRLREVRRLTQDELGTRSDLSADTIRRLEHHEFSPSLRTLRKISRGLGISVMGLFNSFALADEATEELSRVHALLIGRSRADITMVERVLSELFAGLDRYRQPRTVVDESD